MTILKEYLLGKIKSCNNNSHLLLREDLITDNILKELIAAIKDKSPKKIDLGFNNIGNQGAEIIGEYLKTNNNLSVLTLELNDIENEGVKFLVESLKVNKSLKDLDLSDNRISDKGAELLMEILKTSNHIMNIYIMNNPAVSLCNQRKIKLIADIKKFNEKPAAETLSFKEPQSLIDTIRGKKQKIVKLHNKQQNIKCFLLSLSKNSQINFIPLELIEEIIEYYDSKDISLINPQLIEFFNIVTANKKLLLEKNFENITVRTDIPESDMINKTTTNTNHK